MKQECGTVLVLFLLMFLAGSTVLAQEVPSGERIVPEIRATRINPSPPVIDGDLTDSIWTKEGVQLVTDFTQRIPDESEPATESTLVAVAYDEEAVYFAFWCYDSEPDKIARQLVRRDRASESDNVCLRLDPYHDHQTGYEFRLSAAGVQQDWRLFNDDWMDSSWDAVWESGVRSQPWGWSAELRIPYHCLRFAKKDEHIWGVDFQRYISRKDEASRWAFTPQSEGGLVSRLGHLTGIHRIKPARHLEILPYAVTNLETEPKNAGNTDGRNVFGNTGVDIKYGLSSNLTLNATINPDFGQVELDEPVLNLSTYETWFPERRPFFLEGSDLYETNFMLFYSRRVGRQPTRDIGDFDDQYAFNSDFPKATTILGATKLTGKFGSGTSVAFLGAITEEEKAKYGAEILTLDSSYVDDELVLDTLSADTVFREGVVEPMAGYGVFRIKQDVFNNSYFGGMFTLASQDTEQPAMTAGADWRLTSNSGKWGIDGQIVMSRVDDNVRGLGFNCTISKEAGEHIVGNISTTFKDRELSINRLGYTSRVDIKSFWTWWQYRTQNDWWIVQRSWNNVNAGAGWNYDGANIDRSWNFNNSIQFKNNWWGGFGFAQDLEDYDDRETRDHGLWESPERWNAWVWVDTDIRRQFSVEVDFAFGDSRTHSWWASELLLRYRPASYMEFQLAGEFTHDPNQLFWAENPDDTTTIFADKTQDILDLSASASITFHRNLSAQFSAQGLMSGLDYHSYREYLGNGDYSGLVEGYNHDYNYSAVNSTFLVRWEYLPGSTLYVVWTRSRSEVDDTVSDLDLSRDFSRFFSAGAENIFLIKASYWLNM